MSIRSRVPRGIPRGYIMRRGGKMMNHYEFTSKGVRTFCFGEGELSEALRSGASEVVNYGRVYVFRDRHGLHGIQGYKK